MSSVSIVVSVLIGMGILALICVMHFALLWNIGEGLDTGEKNTETLGLKRLVGAFCEATREGNHTMDPEEALMLAIRVKGWLSAGLLGLASLILICATILTWHCISTWPK